MRQLLVYCFVAFVFNISAQTPSKSKLDEWLLNYHTYFYKDSIKSYQYLDSIKTQMVDKTDTAHYWKGKYLSNLSFKNSKSFDFDWRLKILKQAKIEFQISKKQLEVAKINLSMGNVFLNKRVYDSALLYATKAYDQLQELNNTVLINRSIKELFVIYFYLEEYEKALIHVKKYVFNLELLEDSVVLAQGYTNLAATYFRLEKYDSSIIYHRKSLVEALKKGLSDDIAYAYLNLGEIHSTLLDIDSAIFYHRKAQVIFEENGNPAGLTSNSLNLGKVYIKKNNIDSAFIYIKESIRLANHYNDLALLRDAYDVLIDAAQLQSNYELAFNTLKERQTIQDSLSTILKQTQIDDIITKYETREKEQKIFTQQAELSEKEAELERDKILILSLAIVSMLIGSLWLLNRNRQKKKRQLEVQQQELEVKEMQIKTTISSQEVERARYARDLHDGFGQMISILNMHLKNLEGSPKPDERQEVFEASEKVLNEMYGELKSICFDLMPQTLVKNGITAALDEFAHRVNSTGKVFVETNFFGLDERLPEIHEISLFRITQEWINNVIKYSDAEKITIQVTRDGQDINLLIEDDGFGFDASLLKQGKGNGWKNMQTRTNLMKGNIELDTTLGQKGNTLIINATCTPIESKTENTVERV